MNSIVIPNKQDVIDARALIEPYIHNTPVLSSSSINDIYGVELYLKCENFQKMGAFKMRGAAHAILKLSNEARSKGVTTHSSGNFAQALSLAAKSLGVKATIVMPTSAPIIKKTAVLGYGATVIDCEPTLQAREEAAEQVVKDTGATFIHPSNDMDVILGNSSAALELVQEMPNLDAVFAPIGGGGLIAGTCLSCHYFGEIPVYGGEPSGADDAYHSLKAGKIIPPENPQTIADGLRTQLSDQNFPILQKHLKEIFLVEEEEIVEYMRLIWERMKIIIEPSCAVPIAAVLKNKERFKGQKTGVIISGGNVDLNALPF